MPLLTGKKVKDALSTLLALAAIANLDRSNFFPRSAHPDLRFQIVGESLELLALVGLFALGRLNGFGEVAGSPTLTFRLRLLFGVYFAAFLFVIFWRDFFPNDRFSLSAGGMDFLYAPAAGLAIFGLSFIASPMPAKPSEESKTPIAKPC